MFLDPAPMRRYRGPVAAYCLRGCLQQGIRQRTERSELEDGDLWSTTTYGRANQPVAQGEKYHAPKGRWIQPL